MKSMNVNRARGEKVIFFNIFRLNRRSVLLLQPANYSLAWVDLQFFYISSISSRIRRRLQHENRHFPCKSVDGQLSSKIGKLADATLLLTVRMSIKSSARVLKKARNIPIIEHNSRSASASFYNRLQISSHHKNSIAILICRVCNSLHVLFKRKNENYIQCSLFSSIEFLSGDWSKRNFPNLFSLFSSSCARIPFSQFRNSLHNSQLIDSQLGYARRWDVFVDHRYCTRLILFTHIRSTVIHQNKLSRISFSPFLLPFSWEFFAREHSRHFDCEKNYKKCSSIVCLAYVLSGETKA